MARRMIGLAPVLLLSLAFGCGGSDRPKPPLVDVSGSVQIDGKPVPLGEISLMVDGQAPVLLPIEDGEFSGQAMVGENLVRLYAYRMKDPIMMNGTPVGDPVQENYAAEKYNDSSTKKVEIKAGGAEGLKFEVESKPSS